MNKVRLQKVIIFNRAPFERLYLDFSDQNVIVLSGINGAGKTTIISYVVDAFYELARSAFGNEFEDKPYKFYRISSGIYTIDATKISIVYLRFIKTDGSSLDYIDCLGNGSLEEYNAIVDFPDKISFDLIEKQLKKGKVYKHWSISDNIEIQRIFENNVLTYFPAYRYETPSYLNDPYQMKLSFNKDMSFSGYLPNPIEVTSDLPRIANWIMDVVLDSQIYKGSATILLEQVNNVITNILYSKIGRRTRLGIGPRDSGASRIAVMDMDRQSVQIYPSIFNMSSGELALLCLFGELVKQADAIGRIVNSAYGIVLIDEIDKHLHIRLQKEIVPGLISIFPNLQFIVSSHSPFLGVGLAEYERLSYGIIDLDNGGIVCPPQDNDLFKEVYDMMIAQNMQYYLRYTDLQEKIRSDTKPLIITEGKTDWKHIIAAKKALKITDLDIDIYEYEETSGDSKLKQLLYSVAAIAQPRIIIGIFDRDNIRNLGWDELASEEYVLVKNNVYGFAIPIVNYEEYGKDISIEHYYKRKDLTRKDSNGRRIFLGDEFYESGFSKDAHYHTRCKGIDKKAGICGIVDDRVYEVSSDPEEKCSIALSKNDFADLILKDSEFANDIDFSAFSKIFEIIRKIIEIKADVGTIDVKEIQS